MGEVGYCGVCGGGDLPGVGSALRNCETCAVSVHEACLPANEEVNGQPWTCRNCRNGGGLSCQTCCPVESVVLLRVPYLEAATLHQHELCRRACRKALNVNTTCDLCDGLFSYYRVTCSEDGCDKAVHPGCAHTRGCRIERIQVPVNGCDMLIYCREHSGNSMQERTACRAPLISISSRGFINTNMSCFESPFPAFNDDMFVEYEQDPEPESAPAEPEPELPAKSKGKVRSSAEYSGKSEKGRREYDSPESKRQKIGPTLANNDAKTEQGEGLTVGQKKKASLPAVTEEVQHLLTASASSTSNSSSTTAPPTTNLACRLSGQATVEPRSSLFAVAARSIIKPMGNRGIIKIMCDEKNDVTINIRQDYIERIGGEGMKSRVVTAFGKTAISFDKFATAQEMHSLFFDRILDMKKGLGNCAVYAVVGENDTDKRTLENISAHKMDGEPIFCFISTPWSYSPKKNHHAFFEAVFLINNRELLVDSVPCARDALKVVRDTCTGFQAPYQTNAQFFIVAMDQKFPGKDGVWDGLHSAPTQYRQGGNSASSKDAKVKGSPVTKLASAGTSAAVLRASEGASASLGEAASYGASQKGEAVSDGASAAPVPVSSNAPSDLRGTAPIPVVPPPNDSPFSFEVQENIRDLLLERKEIVISEFLDQYSKKYGASLPTDFSTTKWKDFKVM